MAANDDEMYTSASAQRLYGWWFDFFPRLFGASAAAGGKPSPAAAADGEPPSAAAASAPFPIAAMMQALKLTQDALNTLAGSYFRALMAQKPGDELRAFDELLHTQMAGVADKMFGFGQAFAGHPDFAAMGSTWLTSPWAAIGEALKPLTLNLERTYGGLADAFGLAPLIELDEARRDMLLAVMAHRRAQAEYLDVAGGAVSQGIEAMTARLAEMGARGESVDTMLALVRLWAKTMDEAMHRAMQSPRALQASADLLRASAQSRRQQQRVVEIASEALHMPTRSEVDDAYREIQELKREVRRLRKAITAPEPAAAAGLTETTATRAPPRTRQPRQPKRTGTA
jgi:polyhydroxyalkanoate synthesis regulator phasin